MRGVHALAHTRARTARILIFSNFMSSFIASPLLYGPFFVLTENWWWKCARGMWVRVSFCMAVNFIDMSGDLCGPRHGTLYIFSFFRARVFSFLWLHQSIYFVSALSAFISAQFLFLSFGFAEQARWTCVAACFHMLSIPQIKILIYSVFSSLFSVWLRGISPWQSCR